MLTAAVHIGIIAIGKPAMITMRCAVLCFGLDRNGTLSCLRIERRSVLVCSRIPR